MFFLRESKKLMMAVCDVVDEPSLMNHGFFLCGLFFVFLVEVADDEGFLSMHQKTTYQRGSSR
jgi:hypothetical protein